MSALDSVTKGSVVARRLILFVSTLLVLALGVAACGDDDDTAESGDDTTGSEEARSVGAGDQGAEVPTVEFTTSDGASFTLDVTSCQNPSESSVQLTAESETATFSVDASDGAGTVSFASAEGNRRGVVTMAQVGDAGNVAISGSITPADGDAETETFEVTGQCA